MLNWNDAEVRAAFPALALRDDGLPRLYADAPGGTQVAGQCLDRMRQAMVEQCANEAGSFLTSQRTSEWMLVAHEAAGQFLNCDHDEVVFGLNTTSLLFHFSRMLARDWQPGDEIVLSRMDHDANVGPWIIAAEERGVTVRWLDVDPRTFLYRYDTLGSLIGPRTRLVACNHASNFTGTINDVQRIVAAGRAVGAVTVVDAVQSAPHFPIDVRAIGCDILVSSPYKYFGPHAGLLYVSRDFDHRLKPLKIRPSPDAMPYRHAPGTPSFEAQLGTYGAFEHIAWLGDRFGTPNGDSLRARMVAGLAAATAHEMTLAVRFMEGLAGIPEIRLHGIGNPAEAYLRVPTFSMTVAGHSADDVAKVFAARNIYVWDGTFYAYELSGLLGLREAGVVRIGFAHYNTLDEVEMILRVLREVVRAA
jgi:cysteine desulfurase family protein (TIGR01976 family)